jgi:FAD/FMN-containing dehydrogenase
MLDINSSVSPANSMSLNDTNCDLRQSFSRLVCHTPASVRTVTTPDQARSLILDAVSRGTCVNFRGSGHSFGDRCISNGGVLLLNAFRDPIVRIDECHFQVSSGLSWLEVERALNCFGRSSPVLSNWLHVTVAGTLSAGGYGWSSLKHGGQTDNVASVTIVNAAGELQTLDPGSGALWDVATCAAGRLGFLTQCILTTVAARPWVHLSSRSFDSLDSLTAALRRDVTHVDAPEMAWGQVKPGSFLQFAGARSDQDVPDRLLESGDAVHRAVTWDDWLETHSHRDFSRDVAHAWSDYVVPDEAFEAFARLAWRLAAHSPNTAAWRPRMRILAMDSRNRPAPRQLLSAARLGSAGMRFGIGVYLEPPLAQSDCIEAAKSVLAELLAACIEFGGRPYLGSWHELSEAQAMKAFGDDLTKARSLFGRQPHSDLINPGSIPTL